MPELIHCGRCHMSFRVERRFWSAEGRNGKIICGVDPKDVPVFAA